MFIYELPEAIKELVQQRIMEQRYIDEPSKLHTDLNNAFYWDDTPERHHFWQMIADHPIDHPYIDALLKENCIV